MGDRSVAGSIRAATGTTRTDFTITYRDSVIIIMREMKHYTRFTMVAFMNKTNGGTTCRCLIKQGQLYNLDFILSVARSYCMNPYMFSWNTIHKL